MKRAILFVMVAASMTPGQVGDGQAKFADGTAREIKGAKMYVTVEVKKELLKEFDIHVAVIPVDAPDSVWIQGPSLLVPSSVCLVYLGPGNQKLPQSEQFMVVICKVNKGAVATGVSEVKRANIAQYGLEIIASHPVTRSE